MQYELIVREHNKRFHLDLEEDVVKKKEGLFTFSIKVDGGNVVDYMVMETETYVKKP